MPSILGRTKVPLTFAQVRVNATGILVQIVMKAAGQNSKRRFTQCSNNRTNSKIMPSHRVGKQFIHNSCRHFSYEKVPRLHMLRRQFSDNSTFTKKYDCISFHSKLEGDHVTCEVFADTPLIVLHVIFCKF